MMRPSNQVYMHVIYQQARTDRTDKNSNVTHRFPGTLNRGQSRPHPDVVPVQAGEDAVLLRGQVVHLGGCVTVGVEVCAPHLPVERV